VAAMTGAIGITKHFIKVNNFNQVLEFILLLIVQHQLAIVLLHMVICK